MSRKNQFNQKITALYCRISLDDGSQNESMSISNQKLMLKDYAEKSVCPGMSITWTMVIRDAISTALLLNA